MPSNITVLSAHDLRSEARSYQRDKTHNTKWAHGLTTRAGIKCPHLGPWETGCTECPGRPVNLNKGHGYHKLEKAYTKKRTGQASTLARKAFRNDVDDAMDGPLAHVTDTSGDEEVHDASAAPLPSGADFMYSYDASSGPRGGTDVLSVALTQAVQRFENNETEKLVNKEYDVIDETKEGYTADQEDDDFEVIDHSHLQ